MKLLVCFAVLGLTGAAFSALEHDWLHTGFGIAGCVAAAYITVRLRMTARKTDVDV